MTGLEKCAAVAGAGAAAVESDGDSDADVDGDAGAAAAAVHAVKASSTAGLTGWEVDSAKAAE